MAPSPDLADLKQQHRDEIREAEFEWVTSVLPSGSVLELGAGDGKRSRQLRESGRTVLSLEVSGGPYREQAAPGLVFYDGVHVPAPSDTFDIIFSSHVLEHVEDLPELLSECRRVLAPDGIAIHVLPTATWRALTIGTRYLGILAAIRRRLTRRDSASGVAGSGAKRHNAEIHLHPPSADCSCLAPTGPGATPSPRSGTSRESPGNAGSRRQDGRWCRSSPASWRSQVIMSFAVG